MKKILFTGGGTGGHIYPNLAIMDLLKNEYEIVYIGLNNSLEEMLISKDYKFYGISAVKFVRSLTLKNLLIPFKLIKSISECKKILKKEKPDLIFSKGGFVSLPVVLAGHKLNIPCLTHESDFTLGLANKIMSKKCKYVLTSFENTSKQVKNGLYVGSPIRKEILNVNKNTLKTHLNLNPDKKTLLIMCGSLGSKTINQKIAENLDNLTNKFNVIHITGKGNFKGLKHQDYFEIEYSNNIEDLIYLSDVIISRGGSNALFELLSLKKPILIIPLSKAQSRGDQILNADYFYNLKVANRIYEEDLDNINLATELINTLNNKQTYINNLKNLSICGNDNILNVIKQTIN